MNKKALIEKIVLRLTGEIEAYFRAAQATHAESTHEQSKAENKYDTRALEASYLAHGQSRQAGEMEDALASYKSMEPSAFGVHEPIGVGALVELDHDGQITCYFLGGKAGGIEVEHEGRQVFVITPQSPLARQLQGRKQGDRIQFPPGGRPAWSRVVRVS